MTIKAERYKAVSTGQAARYCFVTSYTIVNWIKSEGLKAQRTAGGQYRIFVGDLRQFMIRSGMRTALLDEEMGIRPYCWEFHCKVGCGVVEESLHQAICVDCLVRRSGASNCYQLHGLLPTDKRLNQDCLNCEYFHIWGPDADKEKSSRKPTETEPPEKRGA